MISEEKYGICKNVFFLMLLIVEAALGQGTVQAPVASPPGKEITGTIVVTLTSATPGATILYTTNGNMPDSISDGSTLLYSGPITISNSMIIRAIAIKDGMSSLVATEYYYKVSTGLRNQKNRGGIPQTWASSNEFDVLGRKFFYRSEDTHQLLWAHLEKPLVN
jgi:hypothetical protein